jgi:hypothetical protein
MAKYFLLVKTFSRGKGSSATKAAAYRAGERIRDDRLGAVYDHSDRTDVAHAEIVLPAGLEGRTDLAWARDRSVLWNAVQGSGRSRNARLAREVLVLLPGELTPAQRTVLVRGFARELADRYLGAVDFALHEPRPTADQRHHHAHLLMTCRQVGPEGLGARTTLELSGTERHERGLGPSKDELSWIRRRWAEVTNAAFLEAGLALRIDHRSYREQGLDREPKPLIPQSIVYAERHSGRAHPAGEAIRARYRERVEARREGPEALARVVERQRQESRQRVEQRHALDAGRDAAAAKVRTGAMSREELNAKRREYSAAHREEINRKQRERRRANAAEVNRKQREYLYKRAIEKQAARIAAGLKPRKLMERRPRDLPAAERAKALESARRVTAERSARHWLALRGQQTDVSAEQSAQNWLAYRQAQVQGPAPAASPTPDRSRARGSPHPDRALPPSDQNRRRDRKHDYSL